MKIFLQVDEELEQQHKVQFSEPVIMVHPNGFISVQLDWSPQPSEESYKFKYASERWVSSGGTVTWKDQKLWNVRTVSFEFPDVKITLEDVDYDAFFDIVFAANSEEEWMNTTWRFLHFVNTKYGLVVWFAPQDWEDWTNAKPFVQE